MTHFLLIHGAWHGAWCWERVVPVLEAGGHRCVVPCLPGVGERAAELSEAVDLEAHAAEVARVVADAVARHGRPLVAVAHSYAGAVLLAATERCGEGLAARIFLDAVLVEDEESVMDQVPPEVARERIARARAGGGVPAIPPPPPAALGLTDPEDAAFAEPRLTPHPLATYLQPAQVSPSPAPPSGYVACVRPLYAPIARSARRARRLGWPVWELAAGHDCMISAPEATAKVLMKATEVLLDLP